MPVITFYFASMRTRVYNIHSYGYDQLLCLLPKCLLLTLPMPLVEVVGEEAFVLLVSVQEASVR